MEPKIIYIYIFENNEGLKKSLYSLSNGHLLRASSPTELIIIVSKTN